MAKKMSYREKIALLSEYNPCHKYKKGTRIVKDSDVYQAKEDIDVPEPWTKEHWKKVKYEDYVGKNDGESIRFENIEVLPSDWDIWNPEMIEQVDLFRAYPFRAFLSCDGVTEEMIPYVIFSQSQALSGEYANVSDSTQDGVYIYCKAKPIETIVIPSVICLEE